MKIKKFLFLLLLMYPAVLMAQQVSQNKKEVVDYDKPRKYVIGGIDVEGVKHIGHKQIISLTGLTVGSEITIPSEATSAVIEKLWQQRYFSSVSLEIDSLSAARDTVYLVLNLQERPRVSRWAFKGIKNSEQNDLQDRLSLRRGTELSDYVLSSSVGIIKNYYKEKGYINAEVNVMQQVDTVVKNAVRVTFEIKRGDKVKIKKITFEGNNDDVKDGKIISAMANTRDMRFRNIFKSKKFKEKEYEQDKISMISAFNEAGYRDARIVKDSIYYIEPNRLGIHFVIDQGPKYYFRNITWTGNSLYTSEQLDEFLMIEKGDVYDVVGLQKRLYGDPKRENIAIQSLYTDRGYIFFQVQPVETNIVGDSVDVELRIVEG
ncbi:MAG: outer membrane protein assembly factor BamA, partial [Bacteroidales bacterium]|nr:outer membrane protein assembly factor BamA [Bacteroidales bacterium]